MLLREQRMPGIQKRQELRQVAIPGIAELIVASGHTVYVTDRL
jgi:hypothetical protein